MNLAALPPFGFLVSCFPLKIQGGSAGPTRAVAIVKGAFAERDLAGRARQSRIVRTL